MRKPWKAPSTPPMPACCIVTAHGSGERANIDHERDLTPKLEVEYAQYGHALRRRSRKMPTDTIPRAHHPGGLPFYHLDSAGRRGPPQIKDRRLVNAFVPRDDTPPGTSNGSSTDTREIDVAHRIEEGGMWMDKDCRKIDNIDNWYKQDRRDG